MGAKPRVSRPLELRISYGGPMRSQTATVDLQTGACAALVKTRRSGAAFGPDAWTTQELDVALPKRDIARLVATARKILERGDVTYRDQFAQEGVSFTAKTRAVSATADCHVDVGAGTPYDDAYFLVFRRIHGALASR